MKKKTPLNKVKGKNTNLDYDGLYNSCLEQHIAELESQLQEREKDEDLSIEAILNEFYKYLSQRIETHYDNEHDNFMRLFQTQYYAVVVNKKLYNKNPVKNYFEREGYGHVKDLRKISLTISKEHKLEFPSLKYSDRKLIEILAEYYAFHEMQFIINERLSAIRNADNDTKEINNFYGIYVNSKPKGVLSTIVRIFSSAINTKIIDSATKDVDIGNILLVDGKPYTGKKYSDLRTQTLKRKNNSSLFMNFILECYNNLNSDDKKKFRELINK